MDVLDEIDGLRSRLALRLHEPRRWYGPLRRHLETERVRASTAIEGFEADLDDVAAIRDDDVPATAGPEEREAIRGYWEAMTYVLQLARIEDFAHSTALIRSLHFMMTKYDLSNEPGLWRSGPVFLRDSKSGEIVYEGPAADDVPVLMDELVASLNDREISKALLDGALAHLNIAMIHPFRDGNGRMARCLQSLLIGRGGFLSPVFMSIEAYLGRNTAEYYAVLAKVGTPRWKPSPATRPWLRFVLKAHHNQAAAVLRQIDESELVWSELEALVEPRRLPIRTLLALFDATSGYRVTRNSYRAALAGEVSEQTATRDLQRLSSEGLLVPIGETRGRYYAAGQALLDIRSQYMSPQPSLDSADPFA